MKREKPPLYNMEFLIMGKTEKSKDALKKEIQRMGGKVGSKVHEKLAAIISTEDEVKRMGSRMNEAKDFGIQVVPEDFVEDAKNGGAVSFIVSKSLCDWGTDVSFFLRFSLWKDICDVFLYLRRNFIWFSLYFRKISGFHRN